MPTIAELRILGGSAVGIGDRLLFPGNDTFINLLVIEPSATNVEVFLDNSTDVTEFRQGGGICNFNTITSALDMEINGGICNTSGTFNVDAMVVNGGVVNIGHDNGGSPIVDVLTLNDGRVDASADSVAKTITTLTQKGGSFKGNKQLVIGTLTKPAHDKYELTVAKVY